MRPAPPDVHELAAALEYVLGITECAYHDDKWKEADCESCLGIENARTLLARVRAGR